MNSIEALVQRHVENQDILGAAIAILQDSEITYLGGFGTTSIEEGGARVTPQTLFAYGSICKTICATLVMRLVEEGLLDLGTPVVEYLPGFAFRREDYGQKVTLRHLLSHTAGLPAAGKYWGPRDPDSLRRFVYEQIPHYHFLAKPGRVFLYSNTVICIAGHVAEAVTGKFYDDLVKEYVFNPLQMARSTFDPVIAMTYPLALAHENGPDGSLQVIHRMTYNVSGNPSSFGYGSVTDMANLARMFLNQGRVGDRSFLSASSIAEMHQLYGDRHITAADHPIVQSYQGYGLGFMVGRYRGRRVAKHGGRSQSNECFLELFPDDGAGAVLLTNYGREEPLLEVWAALCDHALGLPRQKTVLIERPDSTGKPITAGQMKAYEGTYLRVESAALATVSVVDGELVLERSGKKTLLVGLGDGRFYSEYAQKRRMPVEFIQEAGEDAACMMIWGQAYFRIEPDGSFQADLQLWQSFEGIYKDPSNSNREETISVRLQDDVLYFAEGEREAPGKTLSNRCFLSDLGLIEFEDTPVDGVKALVLGKATRYYRQ